MLRGAAYATALSVAVRLAMGFFGLGPQLSAVEIARGMGAGALLPYAAAAALRRHQRLRLSVEGARLVLHEPRGPVELGRASLAGVRAWRAPFPSPGFRLDLRDGSHRDLLLPPTAARALGVTGTSPLERYALAWPQRSVRVGLLKFGLFPLLIALVVFRSYQVIGYGGFMGEYHFYGFKPWAFSLLVHWVTTAAVAASWAAVWRAAAEAASLLGALAGPRAAVNVRRGAEIAAGLAYYAAIPAVLAMMFLR